MRDFVTLVFLIYKWEEYIDCQGEETIGFPFWVFLNPFESAQGFWYAMELFLRGKIVI